MMDMPKLEGLGCQTIREGATTSQQMPELRTFQLESTILDLQCLEGEFSHSHLQEVTLTEMKALEQ